MRYPLTVARTLKAAAVMQFKLEGKPSTATQRQMDHRRLLHRIDRKAGTIEVDGLIYRLKSAHFHTIDPVHPCELTPDERICLERIRSSFLASHKLRDQMRWMVSHGRMYQPSARFSVQSRIHRPTGYSGVAQFERL